MQSSLYILTARAQSDRDLFHCVQRTDNRTELRVVSQIAEKPKLQIMTTFLICRKNDKYVNFYIFVANKANGNNGNVCFTLWEKCVKIEYCTVYTIIVKQSSCGLKRLLIPLSVRARGDLIGG